MCFDYARDTAELAQLTSMILNKQKYPKHFQKYHDDKFECECKLVDRR
jgi:hypothetical protein